MKWGNISLSHPCDIGCGEVEHADNLKIYQKPKETSMISHLSDKTMSNSAERICEMGLSHHESPNPTRIACGESGIRR